jgi:uncharacterized protein
MPRVTSNSIAKAPIVAYQAIRGPKPSPCRYFPSCSNYGLDAIDEFGPFRGWLLTLRRILRCNPFGGWGADPVPSSSERNHV